MAAKTRMAAQAGFMAATSNKIVMVRFVSLHGLTRPPLYPLLLPTHLVPLHIIYTSSPSTIDPQITTPRPLAVIHLPASIPTTSAAPAPGPVHCKYRMRLRAECMYTMCESLTANDGKLSYSSLSKVYDTESPSA
jgi:hypothetical protein